MEIVCGHASTARFVAMKLCKRFVSVEPPVELVEAVTGESDAQTVGLVLASPAFQRC